MKKLLILTAAWCILLGCQKQDEGPAFVTQEVVFSAMEILSGSGLKSTGNWECKDLTIDYARIKIDDNYYYTDVYRLDGRLYTQALKFDVPEEGSKTFGINEFFLMHDFGVQNLYPDLNDSIVMATPSENGIYKEYVTDPVTLDFEVNAFAKAEVPIDVLCFQELLFGNFGFDWKQVTQIAIIEQCFFGDVCLDGNPYVPGDYAGSAYAGQANGVQEDVPAIFEVRVFKTEPGGQPVQVPGSPFSNLAWLGEGAPLCVEYAEQVTLDGEVFTFELWVLVKTATPGIFDYQHYATYTCTDEEMIPETGPENVVDFAIGECSPMSTNNYDWLPPPP